MDAEQYYSELEEKRTDEFNAEKSRISMKRLGIAFVTFRDERMTAVWVQHGTKVYVCQVLSSCCCHSREQLSDRTAWSWRRPHGSHHILCFPASWRTTAVWAAAAHPSSPASPRWFSRTNGGSAMRLLPVTSSGQCQHDRNFLGGFGHLIFHLLAFKSTLCCFCNTQINSHKGTFCI